MASTANKSFFSAQSMSATQTSIREQLILGDISFVGVLVVSDVSGTSPTFDAKIQHSHDGTNWFDLLTFTQLTAAGSEVKQVNSDTNVFQYVRGVVTLGGTTPVGTVTLQLFHDRSF